MADEVQIVIKLDDKDAKQKVQNLVDYINNKTEKLGENVSEKSSMFGGFFKTINPQLIAFAGATLAVGKAVSFLSSTLKDAVNEAIEGEVAFNRFQSALMQTGLGASVDSLKTFTDELARLTNNSQDVVLATTGMIQSLNRLDEQGLRKAVTGASILSNALKIDFGTAGQIVARAVNGQVGALSKLGVQFSDTEKKAVTVDMVLEKLQSRFGTDVTAKINTYSSATKFLSNSYNDLLQTIGDLVIKNPALVKAIKYIGDRINKLNDYIQKTFSAKDVERWSILFIDASIKVIKAIGSITEMFINFRLVALNIAKTTAFGMLTLLTLPFRGLAEIMNKFGVFDELSAKIINAHNNVIEQTKGGFGNIVEGILSSTETPITDAVVAELTGIKTAMQQATPEVENASNNIVNKVAEGANKAKAVILDFSQVTSALISTTMQTWGAQLIQGGKAWSNFTGTVLGILGDFAIQMGGLLVAQGLALDALKASLLSLNGAGAVSAGLALIALGGALKAMAGGQSRQSSRGGRGGQEAGGFVANTGPVGGQPQQLTGQNQPSTNLQVIVQGDILDSEETGTRIAKIMSDSFGKQGITLTDARIA